MRLPGRSRRRPISTSCSSSWRGSIHFCEHCSFMGKPFFCAEFLTCGTAVLLLSALSCGAQRDHAPLVRSPDLILITVDTLRADRVGARSSAGPAPTLEALGRAGVTFLDATAHVPLTLPSHASILTGRYPFSHGIHDNGGDILPESVPTLASVLHGAGYHTAAFVSSFVLRRATGLARGFDLYDDRFEGAGRSRLTASALERRGPEVAGAAVRWIATAPRPFFLWVHFYDPHAPYDPPPAFAKKFPGRPYDGEVLTSDYGVSMLLDALSPARRAETVIVATGDHGESLGEHGESEHGILLYDATLHVPLAMQGPGIPSGITVRQQVRHVDLLPTMTDLLGVKAPTPIDGISLMPLLHGSGRDRTEGPISYAESRFGQLHFGWSPLRSVRDGAWKYIDGPAPELYQLSRDPGERANRLDSREGTSRALATALADMVAHGAGPVSTPEPMVGTDAAERLRSLGYVSGKVALADPLRPNGPGRSGGEDPKQAIGRYEQYVSAFNEGLAELETGRSAEAETRFRRLAHEFPLAFEVHQYLARALTARRAFAGAIAELDLAMALNARESVLYFDAARAHADAGQSARALARVAEGRRLDPESFYGALTEGLVARAAGQAARAERAFAEAIRLNPDLAVAHLELGKLAERRGDPEAARAHYRRAVAADPALVEARRALDGLPAERR
ncbi:MAG: sulfatase-like hydrolase/transferase [Vicinamibacterales bacterium]